MNFRRDMLSLFLVLCIFLSLSAVAAADSAIADDALNSTQSDISISEINEDNSNDGLVLNTEINEDVNSEDSLSEAPSNDLDILGETSKGNLRDDSSYTFKDLADQIDNAQGDEVVIEGTYIYDDEKDFDYRNGILFNKNNDFKIIGNNLIINGTELGKLNFSGIHNYQLVNLTLLDCNIYNNANLNIFGNLTNVNIVNDVGIGNAGNINISSCYFANSTLNNSYGNAILTDSYIDYNSTIINDGGLVNVNASQSFFRLINNGTFYVVGNLSSKLNISNSGNCFIINQFFNFANVVNTGNFTCIGVQPGWGCFYNYANMTFLNGSCLYSYDIFNNASFKVINSDFKGSNLTNDNNGVCYIENTSFMGGKLYNTLGTFIGVKYDTQAVNVTNSIGSVMNFTNSNITYNANFKNDGDIIFHENNSLNAIYIISNNLGKVSFADGNATINNTNITGINIENNGLLHINYTNIINSTFNNTANMTIYNNYIYNNGYYYYSINKTGFYNTGNLNISCYYTNLNNMTNDDGNLTFYAYTSIYNNTFTNNHGSMNIGSSGSSWYYNNISNNQGLMNLSYIYYNYGDITNNNGSMYFPSSMYVYDSNFTNIGGDINSSSSMNFYRNKIRNEKGNINFTGYNSYTFNYNNITNDGNFTLFPSSTSYNVNLNYDNITNYGNFRIGYTYTGSYSTSSPDRGNIMNYGNFSMGDNGRTGYIYFYNIYNEGGNLNLSSFTFGYSSASPNSILVNNGGNVNSSYVYYYANVVNSGNFTSYKDSFYGPSSNNYYYYHYGDVNNTGMMNVTNVTLSNARVSNTNGSIYITNVSVYYSSGSYSYGPTPLNTTIINSNGFVSIDNAFLPTIRINNTNFGTVNLTRSTANNWSDFNNDASSVINFVNTTVAFSGWNNYGNITFENRSISQVWIYNRGNANLITSGNVNIYQANVFIGNLINNGNLTSWDVQYMPSSGDSSYIENNGKFTVYRSNVTARITSSGDLNISNVLLKSDLVKNSGNAILSNMSMDSLGIKNEGNFTLTNISIARANIVNTDGDLNLSNTNVSNGDLVNRKGNVNMADGTLTNVNIRNDGGNISLSNVDMSGGDIANDGNMSLDEVSIDSGSISNNGVFKTNESNIENMEILNTGDLIVDGGSVTNVDVVNNGGTISGTNTDIAGDVAEIESIIAQDVVTYYGSGVFFGARFADIEGNKLVDKYVKFIVDGRLFNVCTDADGYAFINTQLPAGHYNVEVINPVAERSKNYTFTINRIPALIVVNSIVENYGDRQYLTIRTVDTGGSAIEGIDLTVKLNGKTYNFVSQAGGLVRYRLPVLAVGTYNVEISASSPQYDIPDKKTTIKVNKVKTIVKAPKVKFKYKKTRYFKFNVKSKSTKKMIKKLKVKVKVYTGKKFKVYKLKTNKNGFAKLNTKKLKKGTHKVVISSLNKNYVVSKKSSIKIF